MWRTCLPLLRVPLLRLIEESFMLLRRDCLLIAVLTLGFASAALAASMVTVDQKNLAFSVPTLEVEKNTIVNFTNSDSIAHNILVSGNGINLNSGLQKPGVAFKAPLTKQGTYQVLCGIHPKMKMTITVN
jgi:plastocyanin